MKSKMLIILIVTFSAFAMVQTVIAQKQNDVKVYRIWIKGEIEITGLFYESSDSSIIILPNTKDWQEIDTSLLVAVSVEEIDKIILRRLNSIGRGAGNGALIGAIPVGIAGVLFFSAVAQGFGDDLEPGAGVAIILMAGGLGTGIGAGVGAIKKTYRINFAPDIYLNKRAGLIQKSLKYQIK